MKNIHKHIHMPHIYLAGFLGSIFGLAAGLSTIYPSTAADFIEKFLVSGRYGTPHVMGTFDLSPTGGNAGEIVFLSEAEEIALNGSGVTYDNTTNPQRIDGNFWVDTVGWYTMTGVQLIPTSNINIMTLSGAAWNENGGWIDFSSGSEYSVEFLPGNRTFSGYAWSDGLGYIRFSGTAGQVFQNRVKIIGNIAGTKSFDTDYALGTKYDSVTTASIINSVKKNLALATRAISSTQYNTTNAGSIVFNTMAYYKFSGATPQVVGEEKLAGNARSLIVEGGDVYIDNDILSNNRPPLAIIALKNAAGAGGNIYIKNTVKNIATSLIAEGSVFSGENGSTLYNDTAAELTQLPNYQLYILGNVISRNTIGGALRTPYVCPIIEGDCTSAKASKYDLNYFRTFDGKTNKSNKAGYDTYSVIIESDGRLLQNPPPGLAK